MADVITRLKVESNEYDSKIKRAAQGLLAMEEACRKVGGTLAVLEKDEKDFVAGLGRMETVRKSARGRLNELTQAYTELSMQYKRLTDEEKKGDFGKALSSSLEQLKGRIGEAKQQLKEVDAELGNTGKESNELSGVLDSLAGRFGLSTKALSAWGLAIGAVTTALKVAKDAFFESETNVDEWGRTVEGAQSIYESFLLSLNSGDFTSFLNNIGTVTQAARDAYNALDELNTRMTIINPERSKLQARQQELRATIREKGATSEEGKAAQQELKQMQSKLDESFKKESKMNYNAFEKLVKERLQEDGINLDKRSFDQLMRTFSDDNAYQRMRNNAKGEVTIEYKNYTNNGTSTLFGEYQKRTDTRNTEQKLLDLFTDEWRQQNSGYLSASFQALGSAAGNRLRNTRYTREGGGSGGGGKTSAAGAVWAPIEMGAVTPINLFSRSVKDVQGDLASAQKQYNEAGDAIGRAAAQALIDKFTNELQMMKSEGNPFADAYSHDFQKDIERLSKDLPATRGKVSAIEGLEGFNKELGQMSGGINSIASGIQQLGVDLPEGFSKTLSAMQGISTILTGILALTSLIQVASDVQAGASVVDAILPFARGGLVPHAASGRVMGYSYSGDNIGNVRLDAGELILNRAQQGNIASQLEGTARGNYGGPSYVDCEKVFVGTNNYTKRSGQGEIVTTSMLKKYGLIL